MTTTPKPTDTFRLFRGGAWYYSSAADVRAAYRYVFTPSFRDGDVGFRLTQSGCRQPLKEANPP